MTRLAILGMGALSFGSDAPFTDDTTLLPSLPVKDVVSPKLSRRYGRLTKMIVVAAHRALADAGIEAGASLPVVAATGIGETGAAIGILSQIHASQGVRISPALVPNSVHNAAAGYLLIAGKNRAPSITVSQGALSGEAALAAAADLIDVWGREQVLVVFGDEAEPAWLEQLRTHGATALAEQLAGAALQEGAAAVVLGSGDADAAKGRVSALLERCPATAEGIARLLEKHDIRPGDRAEIRLRRSGRGEALVTPVAQALGIAESEVHLDGVGPGTVQSAPLLTLFDRARGTVPAEVLTLAAEAEELAVVHFKKTS